MPTNEELNIEEDKKKGRGNILIIIVAAVLLILAIGIAAVFFLLDTDNAEPEEVADAGVEKVRSTYYSFEHPFIVTIMSEGKQRYLQVTVAIKTKQQDAVNVLTKHQPVVKSKLNTLFSAQQLDNLQTHLGRENLNQAATSIVQDFLSSKNETLAIEQVLFTNFVMQ